MEPRHAVLLAVDEEPERTLIGRTLLQKKLYFASRLTETDLGFGPHYYGPYSRVVADATDSQVSNGFLDEQVESFHGDNVFGERRRHSYRLTDDGRNVVQSLSEDEEVLRWRAALERVNGHPLARDFNLLSIAAKVMTILSDIERPATADEISSEASNYGWRLQDEQIQSVAAFLDHLGLAHQR